MTRIERGEFEEALAMLVEAEAINLETGDRRRHASCLGLQGIVGFRLAQDNGGSIASARQKMEQAMQIHRALEDWRNSIPEALTLSFVDGLPDLPTALERALAGDPRAWADVIREANLRVSNGRSALDIFGTYWNNHFRTRLLGGPIQ